MDVVKDKRIYSTYACDGLQSDGDGLSVMSTVFFIAKSFW
jgi:hypothetical protein